MTWDDDENWRWMRRFLRERANTGPLVACYPGFTGAMHERLREGGYVAREPAGFMETGKPGKRKPDKHYPQFRYTATDAGRALLALADQPDVL